ncbi:DNA sulfur modification protein DndE [Psychroflexus salarius]|uniref:DNA sulfur modification protein DndE n=1 Tax=Psychroflexus salarius TaxID=1155689 RepID=A0A1M4WQ49_9FLAO|nr:DndE family protein [Psychroflexus salarius]SHE83356.1 DNA sulfur modification protein DndE [Psychroflexus salarius]
MFTHVRTSKANKEVVSQLTRKLNLGAENVIARIALAYSLKTNKKLDLSDIQDSGGKEYSRKVLFGDYDKYYLALVAQHYQLHISNQDLGKYVKMHVDDGLDLIKDKNHFKDTLNLFT